MTKRSDTEDIAGTDAQALAACVRTLNHTIGELARRYGAAAVAVALTEVMECAACSGRVAHGTGVRALAQRPTRER